METVVAICGAGAGFLLSWLLLYVSDRIWETPLPLRIVIAIGATVACFLFAWFWASRWLLNPRDVRDFAKLIQKRHRELGDRLLGIVELAEGEHPENLSPALVRAAIRQVSRESEGLDFGRAVETDRSRSYGFIFLCAAVIFGSLLFFNPAAGINALRRMFTTEERYTFVQVQDLPDEMIVAHGEEFQFPVGIDPSSFKKPGSAVATLDSLREPLIAEIRDHHALFTVPGQSDTTTLKLRVWDATKDISIVPKHRPAIRTLEAFINYPKHLLKSPSIQVVEGGVLRVLEGSEVSFRAGTERKLAEATAKAGVTQSCNLLEQGFLTEPIRFEKPGEVVLMWRDIYDLEPSKPYRIRVQTVPDEPPAVEFPNQSQWEAILIDEPKEIDIRASDRQGLREIAVEWYVSDSDGNRLNRSIARQVIVPGGPNKTSLKGTLVFAPNMMKIPPRTVVSYFGVTDDYYPERNEVRSTEYKLYILSREEHAELLKDQFERLQARLEDLTRSEEELFKKTEELAKMKDSMSQEEFEERLKDLEAEQQANQREMERLTKKGTELLREALRNKGISTDQLREWARMLESMRGISGKSMKQARESLGQARKNPGQSKENMKKAAEKIAESIKRMQDLLKDFNKAMENLAAQNFVQRLRGLSGIESSIKQNMQFLLKDTVGVRPENLSETAKLELKKIRRKGEGVRRQSEELMEDLEHFFSRTRMEKYDKVLQDMKAVNLLDKLTRQVQLVKENRGITLMQVSEQWAKKFEEWANMLQSKNNKRSMPGMGQGGNLSPEQLELLLKLMRIIQEEYNILAQTKKLDKYKSIEDDYEQNARGLSKKQGELRVPLKEVMEKVPGPGKQPLKKADKAMIDAERLLDIPDTGGETRAAEMEVIELLTNGLNSSSKAMGGNSAIIGLMLQQMMQQMGVGAGALGGGSSAGGGNDDGKTEVQGSGDDENLAERRPGRAAGKSLEKVPPEFREALKGYFDEIDKLDN